MHVLPGNAGIPGSVPSISATDFPAIQSFCQEHGIKLIVVGPEAPLTLGLADACTAAGLKVFGPSRAAAALEGSKTFTKEVADAAGVPTAAWARFEDAAAARAYIRAQGAPIVVKADGLAAGKGVVVAATVAEAEEALRLGLVSRVLDRDGFSAEVLEIATGVAATAPIASRLTKLALLDGGHADLESALQWEALAQPVTLATEDLQEGVRASRERRAPVFRGR